MLRHWCSKIHLTKQIDIFVITNLTHDTRKVLLGIYDEVFGLLMARCAVRRTTVYIALHRCVCVCESKGNWPATVDGGFGRDAANRVYYPPFSAR